MTIRLPEIVKKYLAAAGGYGESVAIAKLEIPREELQRSFDFLDEDYHINRFFHFDNLPDADDSTANIEINGFPQTHIAIDPDIQSIL
jgi:hypothetical protein